VVIAFCRQIGPEDKATVYSLFEDQPTRPLVWMLRAARTKFDFPVWLFGVDMWLRHRWSTGGNSADTIQEIPTSRPVLSEGAKASSVFLEKKISPSPEGPFHRSFAACRIPGKTRFPPAPAPRKTAEKAGKNRRRIVLTAVENVGAGTVSRRSKKWRRTTVQFFGRGGSGRQPRSHPLSERGTGVHSDMEIWSEIRREGLTGALSKRAAIAKYGIGWHTLEKMLAHDEPPGYRQANQRPKLEVSAT